MSATDYDQLIIDFWPTSFSARYYKSKIDFHLSKLEMVDEYPVSGRELYKTFHQRYIDKYTKLLEELT